MLLTQSNFVSSRCYAAYFSGLLGCGLFQDDANPCDNSKEKWDLYRNLTRRYMESSGGELTRWTQCKPRCKGDSFELRHSFKDYRYNRSSTPPTTFELWLFVNQPDVVRETEIYLFDKSDFLADCGAFLGLLLGISCMTIFDVTAHFIAKVNVFRKMANTK